MCFIPEEKNIIENTGKNWTKVEWILAWGADIQIVKNLIDSPIPLFE